MLAKYTSNSKWRLVMKRASRPGMCPFLIILVGNIPSVTRYFEGVQGDSAKRGELFGIENIFKLHEDKLATKMAVSLGEIFGTNMLISRREYLRLRKPICLN
jgi:hypothetical protein